MSFLPKKISPISRGRSLRYFCHPGAGKRGSVAISTIFSCWTRTDLFFSIGDVSGKGVPAALFMAVTKTLLKGIAKKDMLPSETLSIVNRELCVDNESSMFVTLLCGIMNFRSGEVLLANAGHNPPLFISGKDGTSWLPMPPGFLLGITEDVPYETTTC